MVHALRVSRVAANAPRTTFRARQIAGLLILNRFMADDVGSKRPGLPKPASLLSGAGTKTRIKAKPTKQNQRPDSSVSTARRTDS